VSSSPAEPIQPQCGATFRLPDPGPLTLTGRFPATVTTATGVFNGSVTATATEPVTGVSTAAAEAFLVRDGTVVTLPPPLDALGAPWALAAGGTRELTVAGAVTSCAPGGGTVAAGRYEVYARVVITGDDGRSVVSYGGPWQIEVA
jgi:hypothetical protein